MPKEVRIYDCGACRAAIDRDWNAALNIRRLGINLAATEVASEAPKL